MGRLFRIGNFSLLLVAVTEAILPKSSYPPSPCPIPAPNPWQIGKLPELFQGKLEVDFQYHTRFFLVSTLFQEHEKPPQCNTTNHYLQPNMFFPKVTCFIQRICCFFSAPTLKAFRRSGHLSDVGSTGSRHLFVISERHA